MLSTRASTTPSSAIRDLLDHANRPGMISLAGGLPDPTRFPLSELAHITATVLEREGPRVLQYGTTRGDEAVRASLASLFDDLDGAADGRGELADDLVVTTGSQQALDLIARSLLDPGDEVVVAEPEYLGALQVFRSNGASLCPIALDGDGMNTEQLRDRLRGGLRPKALYLVPNFHNPSGASLRRERRVHLNELSSRYGFVVIEDDPYRELYFGAPRPLAAEADHDLTVRLRSTSKILAPGLRIGALAGPTWLTDAVILAKQSSDLHTTGLTQAIVAEALQGDWLSAHLAGLRAAYGAKCDAFAAALVAAFGSGISFERPAGGMFLWAKFVECADTAAWLERCLVEGVCFVPGAAFSVRRDLGAFARLSFATATEAELCEAADRLAAVGVPDAR